MAAARCHGCGDQIVSNVDSRRCYFCRRWFHTNCSLSLGTTARLEWLCNFGCAQAYEAGRRDANSRRQTLQCEQCGETFSTRSNLRTHIDMVHRHKRWGPCPGCDADFATKQKFKLHLGRCRKRTLEELQAHDGGGSVEQGDPTSPILQQMTSAIVAEHSDRDAAIPHKMMAIHSSPAATTPRTL